MSKRLTKTIDSNWFFLALICFVLVLPFSQALVSIFAGVLLLTALVEDSSKNKIERFKKNKILLLIPAVFGVFAFSAIISGNLSDSLYDLRKSLFFLVIPLAFLFGKQISSKQKRIVFFSFLLSVFVATVVALVNWNVSKGTENFSVHSASLISHIRFSFQLVLALWFSVFMIQKNKKSVSKLTIVLFWGLILYFLGFLLFQQSLTGLISLLASSIVFVSFYILGAPQKRRFILLSFLIILFLIPFLYVTRVIHIFYTIDKIEPDTIACKTEEGNLYRHNFNNPMIENGHFVYLYVCESEMREEWNKIASIKYDSTGANGYAIRETLLRYLTSKGLRKDAAGVRALSTQDVKNVEAGIANVIFQTKKYSLYSRIYQTVWEYYVYSKTGYADNQSFSQRIEFARAAISIIKQNFWFGVGTGNWKKSFKESFLSNHARLSEQHYASSHNQYLNYWVKFGIVGLIAICFFLVYPVVKTKRYHDRLFLLLLVFIFFANFADSNLESHMGSSFFLFFYCLFLVTDGIDYLTLPTTNNPNLKDN